MKKQTTCFLVIALFIVCTGSTNKAAIIFFDDFDNYTPDVPWPGEGNWRITEDSLDLIGAGTVWDLMPGNGLYIDMDGSTGNAGAMESMDILLYADDYILSYDVAGNQRNRGIDSFNVSVLVGSGILVDYTQTAAGNDPFTTVTIPFTVFNAATAKIIFDGAGTDNIGLLLDNVSLETVDAPMPIVPVPGAVSLVLVGIGCINILRKRKI